MRDPSVAGNSLPFVVQQCALNFAFFSANPGYPFIAGAKHPMLKDWMVRRSGLVFAAGCLNEGSAIMVADADAHLHELSFDRRRPFIFEE
jgi:hypothetical protein